MVSNITEISAFLMFIFAAIPLPIGALTIFFIDLGTNLIPAVALSLEGQEEGNGVMKRPCRDVQEHRIFNKQFVMFSCIFFSFVSLFFVLFFYFFNFIFYFVVSFFYFFVSYFVFCYWFEYLIIFYLYNFSIFSIIFLKFHIVTSLIRL